MALDPECPCRQRAEDFRFGDKSVEPGRALVACQHRHLPVVIGRDIGIRFDGQDGIGLRPILIRRPPDPREIEPVTIGERKAEVLVAKLGSRHQTAVGWKGLSFRSDDIDSTRAAIAGAQPPAQLDHLHVTFIAPDDDPALIERSIGLKNRRFHNEGNIAGTHAFDKIDAPRVQSVESC